MKIGRLVATIFRTADDVINQKIFEKSIDLILVTDRNGKFIRVSPCSKAILGYVPEEMVGHNGMEFVYPDDLESVKQMMRDQRIHGVTRHFDCRYLSKSGTIVLLTWTGAWAEELEQHFFIGRDITEARAAEQYRAIAESLENAVRSIDNIAQRIED